MAELIATYDHRAPCGIHAASPQLQPELFTVAVVQAEIKRLVRINKRNGSNAIVTMRYLDMMSHLQTRV